MISKEQIAHDLTMVYLKCRYGIDVYGRFDVSYGDGYGSINTARFPSPFDLKEEETEAGEAEILDGYEADDILDELVEDYREIYNRILSRL